MERETGKNVFRRKFKCEMLDGENEKLYCCRVVCRKNRNLIMKKKKEGKRTEEEHLSKMGRNRCQALMLRNARKSTADFAFDFADALAVLLV